VAKARLRGLEAALRRPQLNGGARLKTSIRGRTR
jgi:hypothetical protein